MKRYRRALWYVFGLLAWLSAGCHAPTMPAAIMTGRWIGDGACLSVTVDGCNLVAGCGHGQFSRPTIERDGSFEVDGTYRIEAGPISIEPAPRAHFAGTLDDSLLVITVTPIGGSPPQATYKMRKTTGGTCTVPCL